jgi:bifunctional oligoribonuclease and PAP phosphatase NrnA
MKNNSFEEIWEKLKKSKKILMTLHAGPDGDSFGSCCAMKYVLEREFKSEIKLVSYDELAENLKSLPYAKEVDFKEDISDIESSKYDLILLLDCGDTTYISGKLKNNYKPSDNFIINIDHHPTNTYFGDLNYTDSKKCSTASVLVDLFKKMKIGFDPRLSNMLLLGVSTDSGFFSYENSENALKDAGFLIENGAEYVKSILKPVLYNQSLGQKKFVALLINNLKINKKLGVGYSTVSYKEIKKFKINLADLRLGINELQFIKDFDLVFNLVELEDTIKGSFRSKKGVDVSLFAKELGGGGHREAAAFRLKKMPLEEAEKKVFEAIKKVGIHKYEL